MPSFSIPDPRKPHMSSAGRRRRASLIAGALVTFLAICPAAEALTIRDVIELSRAGVGDEVLLALIETDRTIFSLDTKQLLELQRAGVSERVVIALVRSGRDRADQSPAASPPTTSATAPLAPDPAPGVVVIGGNSEPRPTPPTVIVVPTPIAIPVFVGVPQAVVPHVGCSQVIAQWPSSSASLTGLTGEGFTGFGRFINDGFVPDSRPIRVWGATPRACAPAAK